MKFLCYFCIFVILFFQVFKNMGAILQQAGISYKHGKVCIEFVLYLFENLNRMKNAICL